MIAKCSSDLWQLLFRGRSQKRGLRGDDAAELAQELANRQYATIFRGAKGQVKGVLRFVFNSGQPLLVLTLSTACLPLRGHLVTLVTVLHVRKQQLHRRVVGPFSKRLSHNGKQPELIGDEV